MLDRLNTTPKENLQSPFLKARQEYDSLVGEPLKRARNWQLVAILALTLSFCLVGIIFSILSRGSVVPYIVEVGKEGIVRLVGRADSSIYKPNEASIQYFVVQFVEQTRTIPDDIIILRKHIENAYRFLTSKGKQRVNQMMSETNPFERLKEVRVAVQIISVSKLSPSTFQVEWVEKEMLLKNQAEYLRRYIGTFTVKIKQPTEEKQLLDNPLGIYINYINIAEKLGKP